MLLKTFYCNMYSLRTGHDLNGYLLEVYTLTLLLVLVVVTDAGSICVNLEFKIRTCHTLQPLLKAHSATCREEGK